MRTNFDTLLRNIHDGPGFLMSFAIFISHWAFLPLTFFYLMIAAAPSDIVAEVRFPGMDLLLPGVIISMIFVTLTKLSMNRHGMPTSQIIRLGVVPLAFVSLLGTLIVVYPAAIIFILYIALAGPADVSLELWLGIGVVIYLYWYISTITDPVETPQPVEKT